MPYININEYDNTITGPKSYNGNIVAVPVNTNDGPSDKWTIVNTYDELVQLFGNNPHTSGEFGNSWEYAANLLLKGMSVCVRRITNYLDDNGNNLNALPNTNTAKAVIKVKDILGRDNADYSSLDRDDISVMDSALHSVLQESNKGESVPNELYKSPKIRVDAKDESVPYANTYVLQTDENVRIVGAFADVASTNSEWTFTGEKDNPHYKYQVFNEGTPMDYIYKMNQTEDSNGVKYILGDFFVNDENDTTPGGVGGHVVAFSPTPIPNKFLITTQKQYPDELSSIKVDGLSTSHFVDVTFDAKNKKAVNLVWIYNPSKKTKVVNHRFIQGNVTIEGVTAYKIFETNADLPSEKIGHKYFAAVQSTNTIWSYDATTMTWSNTGASFTELTTPNTDYSIEIEIPFECTKAAINTDIYKHYFNWKNTGESIYIDNEHPELAFVKKVYWTNSNNPIGTTNHNKLIGSEVNINEIIINTTANTTKTSISVQTNGYQDVSIDEDYTSSRLISGNYGITNTSKEAIRIYGFKIIQKAENGEISLIYDAGIENMLSAAARITADPLLRIYNTITNNYISTEPLPKLDDTLNKWYIELDPGCQIYYNRNITSGAFTLKVAGFNDFKLMTQTYSTASGRYELNFNTSENKVVSVTKYFIPEIKEEVIDYTNIPIYDANQNFNLFTIEYIYPGTNGNFFKASIKTIANQGIYVYIYRNKQYLRKIELCSFRFRNANTGRINIFDMDLQKDSIWKNLLSKFGILLLNDGRIVDSRLNNIVSKEQLTSIYSGNIKISINPSILNNDKIKELNYIDSIFAQTGNVITTLSGGSQPSDEHVKHEVYKCFEPLKDKYRYNIKFVSNGGYVDDITYPKNIVSAITNESYSRLIEDAMVDLATSRQDCVAYLDVPYDLPIEEVPNYFEYISTSYAAAYDPWAQMSLPTGTIKWMPPSFIQLYTHAKSIQSGNKLYLPPAGVKRAQVPEIIQTNHDLTSKYIQLWQDSSTPQFINPVIWINGYDYTIYGQKTLYNVVNESDKYTSSLQDLNVRLTANEIKKLIFNTCIELSFDLNVIKTWNEFKSKIEPQLSVMQGEGVLTNYSLIMGTETMTEADLNSGHVVGTVRASVARAATDWDINFELTPNSITFSENDYNSSYGE